MSRQFIQLVVVDLYIYIYMFSRTTFVSETHDTRAKNEHNSVARRYNTLVTLILTLNESIAVVKLFFSYPPTYRRTRCGALAYSRSVRGATRSPRSSREGEQNREPFRPADSSGLYRFRRSRRDAHTHGRRARVRTLRAYETTGPGVEEMFSITTIGTPPPPTAGLARDRTGKLAARLGYVRVYTQTPLVDGGGGGVSLIDRRARSPTFGG